MLKRAATTDSGEESRGTVSQNALLPVFTVIDDMGKHSPAQPGTRGAESAIRWIIFRQHVKEKC